VRFLTNQVGPIFRMTHFGPRLRVFVWRKFMAININTLNPRLADRRIFLIAAIGFPLLVLIGYFKTYYFREFFDVKPLATWLVHVHALVMTTWVLYFTTQTILIRTKNVKLHMTMGLAGIVLAAIVVVVGMATAYDAHLVRKTAPPGMNPLEFFLVPTLDMANFVILFAGAIYYRKRPGEHKGLMLMTVLNFLPAALFRVPFIPPQLALLWGFGVPDVLALASFGWYSWKHRTFNVPFALGVLLVITSLPIRMAFAGTQTWHAIATWLAP